MRGANLVDATWIQNRALTYDQVPAIVPNRGVPKMTYQLKDQDITPPPLSEVEQRSAAADGLAAVVMVLMALALIVLVLSQTID